MFDSQLLLGKKPRFACNSNCETKMRNQFDIFCAISRCESFANDAAREEVTLFLAVACRNSIAKSCVFSFFAAGAFVG